MKSPKNSIWIGLLIIVLLLTMFGSIRLYQQISVRENLSKINLYSLVPNSSSALLEIRNISKLSRDIFLNLPKSSNFEQKYATDDFLNLLLLNDTDNEQSDELINPINPFVLNPILSDSLHNKYALTNKLIVSYHATKKSTHHMFYFKTTDVSENFLTQFIHQNYSVNFQPKINNYRGKTIFIYPLSEANSYLTAYIGASYIVFSHHLYLIREMIDAISDKTSLLSDPSFSEIYNSKSTSNTIAYVDMQKFQKREQITRVSTDSCVSEWATFDLELKRDNIYFTGLLKLNENQEPDLFTVLNSQSHIETLPTHLLPFNTVYFRHMSISNLSEWEKLANCEWTIEDKKFSTFLDKYSDKQVCDIMMKDDSINQIIVIPMKQHFNIKQLMHFIPNYRFKRNGLGKVSINHVLDFFSGNNHLELPSSWYVMMMDTKMICSTSISLLDNYCSQIKEGAFLDLNVGYKHVVNQFEVPYQFLVVDCLSQTINEGRSIVPLIPRSIIKSEILIDNYNAALQINSQDGDAYINIVLASNRDWIPTAAK